MRGRAFSRSRRTSHLAYTSKPAIRMPGRCGTRSTQCSRPRRRDGRLDDPEVLGAVGVGEDDQPVPVVGDVVLGHRIPRRDQDRRGIGPRRVDELHLARDVVVRVEHHEPARFGDRDVEEESRVPFFVDEHILRGIGADAVAHDLAGTVIVVEHGVEQRPVVRGPSNPPEQRSMTSSRRSPLSRSFTRRV